MTASAIYLRAAELVFARASSRTCYAVQLADKGCEYGYMRNPLVRRYIDTMLDGEHFTSNLPWPKDWECAENRKLRVWLLCMMASVAADEDRK